ncbi:MAG: radical SAM protein [Gemmatimonadota bacterium]|nr:radical SAM protein [Gemmatimonadota bacterium]
MIPPHPPAAPAAPEVPLRALDQLWFQVSGTVCNLRCRHCFISCAPDNHAFWFLSRADVRRALDASVHLGVKEYYFTGGEPFMNRELPDMLADSLALGPVTVLTNATLLGDRAVDRLARLAEGSPYSLEVRVSLDGVTAPVNDAIRGEGTFARALDGTRRLVQAGFLPILTAMQHWPDAESDAVLDGFRSLLAGLGYRQPRIKILPPLRIGGEASRTHGYASEERVTAEMVEALGTDALLCASARLVTARGVWVCPILLDDPAARVADTLEEAVDVPARLEQSACYTCWLHGALCANVSVAQAAGQ